MLPSDEELEQKLAMWEMHIAATDPNASAELDAQIAELERTDPMWTDEQRVLEDTLAGFVENLRQRGMQRHSTERYRSLLSHIMFICRRPCILTFSLNQILEDYLDPNDVLEEMSRCAELTNQRSRRAH